MKVKEGKRKDRGKEVRERSKGRRKGDPYVKGRCVFMGRPKEKKERREVEEARERLSEGSETLSWPGGRLDAEPHFRGIKVNGS